MGGCCHRGQSGGLLEGPVSSEWAKASARRRQLDVPVSGQAHPLREQSGRGVGLASEEERSQGQASGPPHLSHAHPTPPPVSQP